MSISMSMGTRMSLNMTLIMSIHMSIRVRMSIRKNLSISVSSHTEKHWSLWTKCRAQSEHIHAGHGRTNTCAESVYTKQIVPEYAY